MSISTPLTEQSSNFGAHQNGNDVIEANKPNCPRARGHLVHLPRWVTLVLAFSSSEGASDESEDRLTESGGDG